MTQVKNAISEFLQVYQFVLEKPGTRDSSKVTTISGEKFDAGKTIMKLTKWIPFL